MYLHFYICVCVFVFLYLYAVKYIVVVGSVLVCRTTLLIESAVHLSNKLLSIKSPFGQIALFLSTDLPHDIKSVRTFFIPLGILIQIQQIGWILQYIHYIIKCVLYINVCSEISTEHVLLHIIHKKDLENTFFPVENSLSGGGYRRRPINPIYSQTTAFTLLR